MGKQKWAIAYAGTTNRPLRRRRKLINCPKCNGTGMEAVQGHLDRPFRCLHCEGKGTVVLVNPRKPQGGK